MLLSLLKDPEFSEVLGVDSPSHINNLGSENNTTALFFYLSFPNHHQHVVATKRLHDNEN